MEQAPTHDVATGMFDLADELSDLRERKKKMEEELKSINARIEFYEAELVKEMINEEVQNFTRGGQLFYLSTRTWASPVPERKAELYSWLKDHGFGDLVQETVNTQTLSAWVREQIEEAELPEDLRQLVNVYEKQTIGIRRANSR